MTERLARGTPAALVALPMICACAGDIAEALANPARSDADRERDARDRPGAVLELAGFGKDMLIADAAGGRACVRTLALSLPWTP